MFTEDTTAIFPECPTFGFTSSPRYLVKIIEREGGYERRTRKWSRPLHRYTAVPFGQRPEADIQRILYFWHAVGGMATGFRFKDYADYKSSPLQDDVAPTDQPFVVVGETYQLVKTYAFAGLEQVREIYKPKGDTIRVANELGVEQAADRWSLDEATGLLTPLVGFAGTPTTWGGEFYVYARFDSELEVEITQRRVQSCSVSMAEIRVPPT